MTAILQQRTDAHYTPVESWKVSGNVRIAMIKRLSIGSVPFGTSTCMFLGPLGPALSRLVRLTGKCAVCFQSHNSWYFILQFESPAKRQASVSLDILCTSSRFDRHNAHTFVVKAGGTYTSDDTDVLSLCVHSRSQASTEEDQRNAWTIEIRFETLRTCLVVTRGLS